MMLVLFFHAESAFDPGLPNTGIDNADLTYRSRHYHGAVQSLPRPLSSFRGQGTVSIYSLMTVLHDAEADETWGIYPHRMPCSDFHHRHFDGHGCAILPATQRPCAAGAGHSSTSSGGTYGSPSLHYRAKHCPNLSRSGGEGDGHES